MLITKNNPVGIDLYIQQLQTKIHNELIKMWSLADASQYQCYGRCYRNKTENGYIAENYTAENDYKEIYWQDSLTAISFFGISNNIKRGIQSEADIHFVMFANLEKLALKNRLHQPITHRADEELRQNVTDIIGRYLQGFSMVSVDLWLENVLKEYPGSRRDERLKFVDVHPVHSFRINLKLIYNSNKKC